jgi:hypothetical protein
VSRSWTRLQARETRLISDMFKEVGSTSGLNSSLLDVRCVLVSSVVCVLKTSVFCPGTTGGFFINDSCGKSIFFHATVMSHKDVNQLLLVAV